MSFGDQLFGGWVLLPLQRRYNTAMKLAVFGEHVGMLRSLGVTPEQVMMRWLVHFLFSLLVQCQSFSHLVVKYKYSKIIINEIYFLTLSIAHLKLCIPMERFTSPPEDSLPLLRLYFRSLITGTLKPRWCPVLYVVALCHVNSFIFSQDAVAQVQHTQTE